MPAIEQNTTYWLRLDLKPEKMCPLSIPVRGRVTPRWGVCKPQRTFPSSISLPEHDFAKAFVLAIRPLERFCAL